MPPTGDNSPQCVNAAKLATEPYSLITQKVIEFHIKLETALPGQFLIYVITHANWTAALTDNY